jgi:hypothetical protein
MVSTPSLYEGGLGFKNMTKRPAMLMEVIHSLPFIPGKCWDSALKKAITSSFLIQSITDVTQPCQHFILAFQSLLSRLLIYI